jgi:hypothetical protein
MANFFNTLAAAGGKRPPEFLSDHPDDGNRIKYILKAVPDLPVSANPIHNTPEFDLVKSRLLGGAPNNIPANAPSNSQPSDPVSASPGYPVKAPAGAPISSPSDDPIGAPPNALISSSISSTSQLNRLEPVSASSPALYKRPEKPAGSFKTYREDGDRFAFEAPSNWEVMVINDTDANSEYILSPRGGNVKYNGGLYMTHGISIGAITVTERDLRSATEALVQKELEANPDYRIVREPAEAIFQNQKGLATVIAGSSVITGLMEINFIFTAVTSDGRLFYLTTVAPEDEAGSYYSAFEHIQQSVKLTK